METVNTFSQTTTELSRRIYQTFVAGGVINKTEYTESIAGFQELPAYRELIVNQAHYEALYWQIGYHLIHDNESEYFYIKSATSDDDEDGFNESSLKIMAILTIISRLATQRGQAIATLAEPVQGIESADLQALAKDEEITLVLKSLNIKNTDFMLSFLRKRNLVSRVGPGRHILTKGSLSIIETVIAHNRQNDPLSETPE